MFSPNRDVLRLRSGTSVVNERGQLLPSFTLLFGQGPAILVVGFAQHIDAQGCRFIVEVLALESDLPEIAVNGHGAFGDGVGRAHIPDGELFLRWIPVEIAVVVFEFAAVGDEVRGEANKAVVVRPDIPRLDAHFALTY